MKKGDKVKHIDDPWKVWTVVRLEQDSAGNPLVWVCWQGRVNAKFFRSNLVKA